MTDEQWQVAGDASEIYEKYLVPAIFEPWAGALVAKLSPGEGASILDVACGTGIVARTAAKLIGERGKVTGLDLNAGMLAVARDSMSRHGIAAEWHEGSVLDMPFPDEQFDCVYCQAGLQFFPDRSLALREMFRVLKPGGELAAVVWRGMHRSPGFEALAKALDNHVGQDAASIMEAPFVFGDSPDELRALAHEAGFLDATVVFETRMMRFPSIAALFDLYTAGSPIAQHLADIGSRGKLISELEDRLSVCLDDEGLAFPLEGQVLTAAKR